jgi:tetratricopeptide (TPR) repeat protein
MLWCIYVFWGYFVADANHNMGIFYSKQGDWIPALKHYNKVIEKNPNYTMAHYFMGNVYNDRWAPGDAKLALEKYNDVKKLSPNYVQVHHQTGVVYLKLGEEAKQRNDTEKVKEYWTHALHFFDMYHNLDPVFTQNYLHMAYLHVQAGDLKKAEGLYRAALLEKPQDLETIVNLGNILYLQNNFADAEIQFLAALSIAPNYPNALKNLATLYEKINRKKESADLWQRLRQANPKDPDLNRVVP